MAAVKYYYLNSGPYISKSFGGLLLYEYTYQTLHMGEIWCFYHILNNLSAYLLDYTKKLTNELCLIFTAMTSVPGRFFPFICVVSLSKMAAQKACRLDIVLTVFMHSLQFFQGGSLGLSGKLLGRIHEK